jgi:MHS family proline/betaine transporter-like MFS transporter
MVPGYYLIGAALLGLVSLTFLTETSARPLNGSLPNVETDEEARQLVATQERNPNLNVELMPLPYVPFAVTPDGQTVALSSQDPDVRRSAAAARLKLESPTSR